jgi:transposase
MQTIPGIKEVAAAAILAEMETDMSRFPSARHLASWSGPCPTNQESAGTHVRTKASYFYAISVEVP